MSNSIEVAEEDQAIQDTLSMSIEARLDLLANRIAEKILADRQDDEKLYRQIVEESL